MKSLLFKRIFQARKKRIMVYNKIRKVWEKNASLPRGIFICRERKVVIRPLCMSRCDKRDGSWVQVWRNRDVRS